MFICLSLDSPLTADLWLLNSCTVKGPSEDSLKNSIRKGKELGKPLVVAGCVPQGQRKHSDVQGLSVVGVSHSLEYIISSCRLLVANIVGVSFLFNFLADFLS